MTDRRRRTRRRIPMRLWLGFAFAAVTTITAGSVFLFVNDSSNRALREQAGDLAVGRTANLADSIQRTSADQLSRVVSENSGENFHVAVINAEREPLFDSKLALEVRDVPGGAEAIQSALAGRRYRSETESGETIAAAPVFGERRVRGAVLSISTPPPVLQRAIDDLRSDSVRALGLAMAIGILFGFVVASLITIRIKRLASSAERMAAGSFDVPLRAGGGDEIADLSDSLEVMRDSLRDSFGMLATERDRLSATLDGLSEAVILVGDDGDVRFSNPAAHALIKDGRPAAPLMPSLKRCTRDGSSETASLVIDGRVFAAQGRRLAAEHAVLLVVRDRTDEFKRDQAEREFVSNAAHELRNPLAGISGVIEVLRDGAKDDPEARDRFLRRLAYDTERMTRLTESLLTLARVEAQQPGDSMAVADIEVAIHEARRAVPAPEGMNVEAEIEGDLVCEADPVLVRQVLIGLLSNAFKHTPAPGTVTLRAFGGKDRVITIEVSDTGAGIPEEEQARVFERFYRSESAREGEGFGLGLAIAKRMVDIMGGEIGVRSSDGAGSTFWVRLRAAEPSMTPVA